MILDKIGGILQIGGGIAGKITDAVNRRGERKAGNQEAREQREYSYREKFGSQIIFALTAAPFIALFWIWFLSPLLKHLPYGAELLADYKTIVDTIGVTALMMVIGALLGVDKLQDHVAEKKTLDFAKHKVSAAAEVEKKKAETIKASERSAWEIAYDHIIKAEGKYSDDPQDRGGETYKGISRRNWQRWPGWQIIDDAKKRQDFPTCLETMPELQAEVKGFYESEWWKKLLCDKISSKRIAIELFDTAVNCGPAAAVKFLQKAINRCNFGTDIKDLLVDGNIGDKTIQALESLLPRYEIAVQKTMSGYQFTHYDQIVAKDASQEKFWRGWMQRV